ncbi:uncharacterized protein fndc10 [Brienomyrus brachyistius]|uniref:uncharacterized protein fndc10 n=1 Tax=Brienomyrus brachyistius TaxID=42636 RepID=UPI0020B44C97|nr:uncharacterized protein fndc10 [Brienomyrus brachyistius]
MPDQLWMGFIAGAVLLLGTCQETAGFSSWSNGTLPTAPSSPPSRVGSGGESLNWVSNRNHSNNNYSDNEYFKEDTTINQTLPKIQHSLRDGTAADADSKSRGANNSGTVRAPNLPPSRKEQGTDNTASLICAYRVMESGGKDQLCFRDTQHGFQCLRGQCYEVRSAGGQVVANVLANGSVLIQWAQDSNQWWRQKLQGGHQGEHTVGKTGEKTVQRKEEQRKSLSRIPPQSGGVGNATRHRGFGLSCWWNGSYTQFECAGVHLGVSCRDYLLSDLHENVPYRICLRPLAPHSAPPTSPRGDGDDPGECVEFTVSPSGMQDIVVAMTTVGGAICVMLVVICLLVAYITENIMSPAPQRARLAPHARAPARALCQTRT